MAIGAHYFVMLISTAMVCFSCNFLGEKGETYIAILSISQYRNNTVSRHTVMIISYPWSLWRFPRQVFIADSLHHGGNTLPLSMCLLTELSMCSKRQFSGRVKSMVRGGKTQPSTLIFSRLVSFSGQKGMADCIWNGIKL